MSDSTSEFTSIGSYRIEPLKAHNWMPWKRRMQAILRDQGLEDYLTKEMGTGLSDEAKKKWVEGDAKARTWIELAISDAEMVHVIGASTAKAMWDQLCTVKEPKGRLGILATRRALYRATAEEGFNMGEHIAKLRCLQEELHIMGSTVSDEDFVMILITSLPDSWDTYTTSLLGSTSTNSKSITSQELVGILIDEARRRGEKDGTQGVAMQAKGSGKGSSGEKECYNCHKKGHLKKDCWAKGGGREGQGPKGRKRKEKANQAVEGTDLNELSFASIANATEFSKYDWILDSGSTSHICPLRDAFVNYTALTNHSIEGVGGKPVTVAGRGTVFVQFSVNGNTLKHQLRETLHVPDAPNCLYSVSRLDDGGGRVDFRDGVCELRDGKGNVIGLGTKKNRLYRLTARALLSVNEKAHFASSPKLTWDQAHRRYGHIAVSSLQKLVKSGMVEGLNVDESSIPPTSCDACTQGRMAHKPFPQEAQNRSQTAGERQLSDIFGPVRIKSIGGFTYFVSFTDDATRFSHVLFLRDKGEAFDRVTGYCAQIERRFGRYPRWLRFDNGREFVNSRMQEWATSKGITLELTAPYSSSQNGVAERFNRTHMELARSMLVARNLPSFLWDEAVSHANYLRNRAGTRALDGRTPYEAWYGRKPNVSHLREFGCDVWVLDESTGLSKLNPRAKKMVFMGFVDGSKSIRYYDASTRKIKVSRNVSFNENEAPSILDYIAVIPGSRSEGEPTTTADAGTGKSIDDSRQEPLPTPQTSNPPAPIVPQVPEEPKETRTLRTRAPIDYKLTGNPQARKPAERFAPALVSTPQPTGPVIPETDLRYTPDFESEGSSHISVNKEMAFVVGIEEIEARGKGRCFPQSVDEARASSEAKEWEEAMQKEMDNLKAMETWELVDLPPGRTAIGSRMVFSTKEDNSRRVSEYKARLVAQGFGQKPGIDYNEDGTFAPVMRFDTLRTGLALAAVHGWKMRQFDVKGAYLHARLDEEIYMRQPPGFDDGTGRVCRLLRSLYGLKQAGNLWNKELHRALEGHRFQQLRNDNCCYIRRDGDDFEVLFIWVDDMLCLATSDARLDAVERDLSSCFTIKSIGTPSRILGLQISVNALDHSISICQTAYIESLLERYGLANANPVSTPLDPNVDLDRREDDEDSKKGSTDQVTAGFPALIGSLMYLAIGTRPDIAFAVTKLAQYTSKPTSTHWTAVKRIFRYLKGTKHFALTYGGSDPDVLNDELHIFCDADWGSNRDRKSTSGYMITMAGGAIAWSSKKQNTVALSTAEAEYVSATHVAKQVLWQRSLLRELGIHTPQTSTVFTDNQAAISIAHHPEHHAKTKHIDISLHFLRDLVRKGTLDLVYINTSHNPADIFTKGLPRQAHEVHTHAIGVLGG